MGTGTRKLPASIKSRPQAGERLSESALGAAWLGVFCKLRLDDREIHRPFTNRPHAAGGRHQHPFGAVLRPGGRQLGLRCGAAVAARLEGGLLLRLLVHADLRVLRPEPGPAPPFLLAPVPVRGDSLPVLEGRLLPVPPAGIALRERDRGPQGPRGHGGNRVQPALLPARDHAVLPGLPAGPPAAAADREPSRPRRRRRGPGPGGTGDRHALEPAARGDDQVPGSRTRSATCSTRSAAASSPSTWTRYTRGCAGTHG